MHVYKRTAGFELLETPTNGKEGGPITSRRDQHETYLPATHTHTTNALSININVGSRHSNAVPSIAS